MPEKVQTQRRWKIGRPCVSNNPIGNAAQKAALHPSPLLNQTMYAAIGEASAIAPHRKK